MTTDIQEGNPLLLTNQRLRRSIRYLKKRRLLIIIVALLCGLLGGFYASVKKPLYIAELTFTVEEEDKLGSGGLLNIASQFGLDISGGNAGGIFSGDNIVELFKSRKIIESSLLLPFNGDTSISFADKYLDIYGKRGGLPGNFFPVNSTKNFSRQQDSVLTELQKAIIKTWLDILKPDKRLNIYKLSFKSRDEEFAKSFSEALVVQTSAFYADTKTKKAKQNVDILQDRVDSIRQVYDRALYSKAGLTDANVNPAFQSPLVDIQKKQTDITVLGTAYTELVKNLELAKYSLLRQTPLLQVIDKPRYPLEKKESSVVLFGIAAFVFFGVLVIFFLLAGKLYGKIYRLYFA